MALLKGKNRTLIEAARTLLADSLLPIPFWVEAVNTACYVQNRVLVTKPHNKTPYELLHGRLPSIGFMRPFGCPVTILNTLDPLGSGPAWLFDIDSLTQTMNYHPVIAENQTNSHAGFQDTKKAREEGIQTYVLFPVLSDGSTHSPNNNKDALDGKEHDDDIQKSVSPDIHSSSSGFRDLNVEFEECTNNSSNGVNATSSSISTARHNCINNTNNFSVAGPSNAAMPNLEDLTHSNDVDAVGAEADINNLESIISVSPIPTTRIHKDHLTSQIIGDLSSTTQTRSMARAVRDQVGDLSTHTTRFISPTLTRNVFANMRRVGKGFLEVETPLFEDMLVDRHPAEKGLADAQVQVDDAVAAAVEENVADNVSHDAIPSPLSHDIPSPSQKPSSPPQQPQSSPQAPPQGEDFPANFQQVLDTCSALIRRVEHLEHDNVAQKLEIVKLKARVKKLEKTNKVKSLKFRRLRKVGASRRIESSDDMEDVFNQRRMINEDEGIELVKDTDIAESEGRHAAEQAEKQAEIYNLDLDHSSKVLSMQEDDSEVQEVVEVVTTAKLITDVVTGKGILVETPKPMKKKDQIELDAEYARKLQEEINKDHEEFNKDIDWDAAMDHVNKKYKNPQYIKRYQGMKKRPQTESEARKNMMIYLKNTAGYKMDFFKGMTEEMEEEDQEIIKSINETPAQKAAKRRKLSEEAQEAEDLRKRLEVVDDEDDDVLVEATPLARKVPVVDYQIVLVDNKPRFKIIKADETHQFYISFTTLLKNFDKEDLENLWGIVKERFSTSKPTNFSDEYLLLTLKTMFEKPDEQDAIWRNQKSVHGLALLFLLVERRYPLLRFTLEQLVNVTKHQVEEESEMSLELLRFTRQQLQEYQQG
nr:hypothetical protein [Tanacetum cinerariifolium]